MIHARAHFFFSSKMLPLLGRVSRHALHTLSCALFISVVGTPNFSYAQSAADLAAEETALLDQLRSDLSSKSASSADAALLASELQKIPAASEKSVNDKLAELESPRFIRMRGDSLLEDIDATLAAPLAGMDTRKVSPPAKVSDLGVSERTLRVSKQVAVLSESDLAKEEAKLLKALAEDPLGAALEKTPEMKVENSVMPLKKAPIVPVSISTKKDSAPTTDEVVRFKKYNADLTTRAVRAENSLSQVKKELAEKQNRLMLAEAEVERLSSLLQARNRTAISSLTDENNVATSRKNSAFGLPSGSLSQSASRTVVRREAAAPSDMPIAVVIADKANLRAGPGNNNSVLLNVSKGTRLAVETRQGNWLRVTGPTGSRAWVSADVVRFTN